MDGPLFKRSQGAGSALSKLTSQDQPPKAVSFLAHHSEQDMQRHLESLQISHTSYMENKPNLSQDE